MVPVEPLCKLSDKFSLRTQLHSDPWRGLLLAGAAIFLISRRFEFGRGNVFLQSIFDGACDKISMRQFMIHF